MSALPVTELGQKMQELEHLYEQAVKNKSYRLTPVGRQVHRYLRSLRWSDARENTLEAYEHVLALLALDHGHFGSLERFCAPDGTEYLRDFLDVRWGESSTATRRQRLSIVRAFFAWSVGEGLIPYDPARSIKSPRVRNRERSAFAHDVVLRLVAAQDSLRDQCALELLAHMALRKDELRVLQIGDVDLVRNLVTVNGKGGEVALMPIGFPDLAEDLYLHIVGEGRQEDEYLLYPRNARLRPMDASSVHRWFKRCLANAGLPMTMELHELRHSAADELHRVTRSIVLAQQLLRHKSVGTTQVYLHPTREDLRAGMLAVHESWREPE